MSKSSDTQRIYRIEETWRIEEWPMDKLRRLAKRIWKEESAKPMPLIVAGDGMSFGGRLLSFCSYDADYIQLARNQRDPKVLIHELTHALVGPDKGHGKEFEKKYCSLLKKYKIKIVLK